MIKRHFRWLPGFLAMLMLVAGCAPLATPEAGNGNGNGGQYAIELPEAEARVTLPLHVLGHVGEPGEQVTAILRWEDGAELSETFTVMEGPGGEGLLVGGMDWQTETRPPQPATQSATLTIQSQSGTPLAEQTVTVVGADDPDTTLVDLYWLLPGLDRLESEQRRVLESEDMEATALRELLWGPPPRNFAGFETAIPTPEEVLTYPGREQDWGARVRLLDLKIENGVATADFSGEIQAYGGGSARVQTIHDQITRTLQQFPAVEEVRIAVAGETEGVLQP